MFSYAQRRGLLYLLLIILVAILLIDIFKGRPSVDAEQTPAVAATHRADSVTLFEFDPNTATLKELLSLGLSSQAAVSLIRYRSAGKVFRIKEDVYGCYNISDSVYYAIESYIKISEEYQYKKRAEEDIKPLEQRTLIPLSPFLIDTVGVEYLRSTGVLSRRQAEVFVRWHSLRKMRDMEEVRECYVVSASAASKLEPYIIFPTQEPTSPRLVNLNLADSAELRSVTGIGEKSVVTILEYRQKLGGFYSVEQLSEVNFVTESNFERIIKQISCDSCDISKIDVNFAVAKNLIEHPYISRTALRRLLKTRQIKGGWSNLEELIEDNIFTHEEAARLRPYLRFEPYTKRDYNTKP